MIFYYLTLRIKGRRKCRKTKRVITKVARRLWWVQVPREGSCGIRDTSDVVFKAVTLSSIAI